MHPYLLVQTHHNAAAARARMRARVQPASERESIAPITQLYCRELSQQRLSVDVANRVEQAVTTDPTRALGRVGPGPRESTLGEGHRGRAPLEPAGGVLSRRRRAVDSDGGSLLASSCNGKLGQCHPSASTRALALALSDRRGGRGELQRHGLMGSMV